MENQKVQSPAPNTNQPKTDPKPQWESIINDWKLSGQNQRQYCLQRSLQPHKLSYWHRRLLKENNPPSFKLLSEAQPKKELCTVTIDEIRIEFPKSVSTDKLVSLIKCLI